MKLSSEIKESITLKLSELAKQKIKQGQNVISFAIGEPDFKTPSFVINETIKALNDGFTGYSTSQGLIELREQISKDYNKRYNASYSSSEIIILPGAKNAIFTALASILIPNDEVIIISPYYVSYPAIIKLCEPNSKIIDIPMDNCFKLPIHKIKEAITKNTKAIILNYPNNPTGQILKKEEVLEMVNIVKENNLYLLSDEIYDQIILDGMFYSFSSFKEIKDKLIVINGYSKTHAMTGFRIGYALSNKAVIHKMNLINQTTNTNTNTIVQRGCLAIYEQDDSYLKDYLKQLKEKVDYLDKELNKTALFKGFKPKSTFYYFIDISKTNMDSTSFSNVLLDKYNIVVTPGIAFGIAYDSYIRLSLSTTLENIKTLLKVLNNFN